MTLSITISGGAVTPLEGTLQINQRVDDKDSCSFSLDDASGTLTYQQGQPVVVTDSVQGTLFSGFIYKPTAVKLVPNAHQRWNIQCRNQWYHATKKASKKRYKKRSGSYKAGAIVANQIQQYLAPDGVQGNFSLSWTEQQSEWQSATLSGVTAATNLTNGNPNGGNLELVRGGTTYTSTAAAVSLPTSAAIALSGVASSVASNPVCIRQIWTGSMLVNNVGVATLFFDVWISSTSPSIVASVDFTCSDGTIFSNTLLFDVQEISNVLTNDLSGLANDQWYSRNFLLQGTALAGKTITSVSLVLSGNKAGTYNTFFRNIYFNNNGTIVQFFSSTLVANNQAALVGYSNVSCSVVQAASASSQIIAISAGSYSSVNILQASQVVWTPTVPAGCSLLIESSIDNQASWQAVTNGGTIPNLLPGVQLSLVNLSYRATMKVGVDPSQNTLGLTGFQTILTPSYAATKTDLEQGYGNASGTIAFSAGTLTNTQAVSNQLTLSGFQRNYSVLDGTDQTQYSSGIGSSLAPFDKQMRLQMIGAGDVRLRMDPAGQWQNFTCEVDVQIISSSLGEVGLVYRTTGWQNNNDTYAYTFGLNSALCHLGRGTNSSSGSGTFTSMASASISLAVGSTHRIKIVVNGNSHIAFIDGTQILSANDSTFPSAGYIGFRLNNNSGTTATFFNNFGVVPALFGTWQSAALSISSPTTYGNSVVGWDIDGIPDNTCSISMQSSVDGGSTFQNVTNGGAIPNLSAGQSLAAKTLILKATLAANSASLVPVLNGASVFVLQQYSSTGYRTNAPLINDTMTRANVGSGFGPSTDLQTYTQVGTGTTNLTGNEAQIVNTTGDVHMVPSGVPLTTTDENTTLRFQLSASTISAGVELRYVDSNNFYRLLASQNSLSILFYLRGVAFTLATATPTISIGTFYRLRFQVIGAGPITFNGRVWPDGSQEPQIWNVQATQ